MNDFTIYTTAIYLKVVRETRTVVSLSNQLKRVDAVESEHFQLLLSSPLICQILIGTDEVTW